MGPKPILSVIGLGKLGFPILATCAEKGYAVIGADKNPQTVASLQKSVLPCEEPLLEEYLRRNKTRISATTSVAAAVSKSDISFVIVPTPSDETGAFTNRLVLDAIEQVGAGLRSKAEYHLVVLSSTVMPGSSRNEIVPALESASGKICGDEFGYCYSPQFVALGTVIKDLLNPDFCLIGESDSQAGGVLQKLYTELCENEPVIKRMNYLNAELTKISVNAYVTTKISFANTLSEVCERLPGANIEVVGNAVGGDARIGAAYLRGGTAYGGPCFPRDNIAFSALCRSLGVPPKLAEATDIVNERQAKRVFDRIVPMLAPKARVSILGTAYKTRVNFIGQSQGIDLSRMFAANGFNVTVFDPVAMDATRELLGNAVCYSSSLRDAVKDADAVLIMLPYDEFRSIDLTILASPETIVLDCWRLLERHKFNAAPNYLTLGINSQAAT